MKRIKVNSDRSLISVFFELQKFLNKKGFNKFENSLGIKRYLVSEL